MLAVSPHLDDVAFSVGGTLLALRAAGWQVTVLTCFTASVPGPTGFALACQTDKGGVPPDADYMALRRGEDDAALRLLGVSDVERLGLLEAPHRGYDSAPSLFGGVGPADEVHVEVARALASYDVDLVLAPQGCGAHVDHRQVVRAVLALGTTVGWYRDTPYVIRDPAAPPAAGVPRLPEQAVAVQPYLQRKANACAAYTTQLRFQFGGEQPMRAALRQLAAAEGQRLGAAGPAEALLVPAGVLP